jgi:hypothetical protein
MISAKIGLQGFAPKLAKREIESLARAAGDPRYIQISLPVQRAARLLIIGIERILIFL